MQRPEHTGIGLSAQDVAIAYGRNPIVSGLDLAIPTGCFTALIGPNGSGKSTILRALGGLTAPNTGTILLDGHSIARLPTKEMARRVGLLAQGPAAPEGLTVTDLVRQGRYPHRPLFGRWSEQDAAACEEALALTDMAGLRDRPLDSLSGGQRQRAWIAMTLAQQTAILLLDEPTTFLDLAHQIEVMELITQLVATRGKTIVAVLHDLNQAARHADHMVLLKAGRIEASGTSAEVMTSANIQQVFAVASTIILDPLTGTPLCLPLPRRPPQS
ncbi:iron-enterobactin transporter ATP-binding protein [Azorhizobium oxalatiphilum]|uniref:Iron-enterobactin transporter ATP-binding protein n=1 Tax=Azorhizobium oxalatiphilum TaxID=980631 RepID=A0A917C9X8_9HYPH|nr:ABC transporter ATP-binding protein [Azorhizobium oxalatiphilum]GGF74742.1 iron-enterobactin transporter ATP-binding protein [Azorhizobium oxalatiphilum]